MVWMWFRYFLFEVEFCRGIYIGLLPQFYFVLLSSRLAASLPHVSLPRCLTSRCLTSRCPQMPYSWAIQIFFKLFSFYLNFFSDAKTAETPMGRAFAHIILIYI